MRLHSIKLAGFKSFVDASTLKFPSAMTAILGPNGCGKSNVIDAIRWVMGESSAKQLRGDAMSDVIFAGTTQRKPVSFASVELHFENTLGKLGGAYNAYHELAIRRQVTRDGKSEYFLNGTRCRRKDITDIFLGTGLGPRSYAVIEQGMISRLVEAKPDDLRVFIEEAAGVSRYQSKRKETEQHLEHTRQNLSRLDDVHSELASQIRVLKRQSQAVVKYRELENTQHKTQLKLWQQQLQRVNTQQQDTEESLATLSDQLNTIRTARHDLDTAWNDANRVLNELLAEAEPTQALWQQAERALMDVRTDMNQAQQTLQHVLAQLNALQNEQHTLDEQIALDVSKQETLTLQLSQLEQQLLHLQAKEPEQQSAYVSLEAGVVSLEQQLAELTTANMRDTQLRAQTQTRIDDLNRQALRMETQKKSLNDALQLLNTADVASDETEVMLALDQASADINRLNAEITVLVQRHEALVAQQNELTNQQQHWQQQQSGIAGEMGVLSKLLHTAQEHVQQGDTVDSVQISELLLNELTLTAAGQVHSELIEQFLAGWLTAGSVNDLQDAHHHAYVYLQQNAVAINNTEVLATTHALTQWIEYPHMSWWAGVGVVESFADALAIRHQLTAGQSLLSYDGYWLGVNWRIHLPAVAKQNPAQGLLQHKQRHDVLTGDYAKNIAALALLQQQLDTLTLEVTHARDALTQAQQALQTQVALEKKYSLQLATVQSQHAANQRQREQNTQQLHAVVASLQEDNDTLDELRLDVASLIQRLTSQEPLIAEKRQALKELRQRRDDAEQQHRRYHEQRQQLLLEQQTARVTLAATEQSVQRVTLRMTEIKGRIEAFHVQQQQLHTEQPALALRLEDCEQHAEQAQQHWQSRQNKLEVVQRQQQQFAAQRQQSLQQEDSIRDALESKRLAWQGAKTQQQILQENIANVPSHIRENLELFATDAVSSEQTLEQKLLEISQSLQCLGELNLTAPTQLAELEGRSGDLMHQVQDLQDTIAQLEEAMQAIDVETRALFMSTFTAVNNELQQLFPKVFGGGMASLMLENDWQSGVRFMAQPPGKKNTSITLLSGGEKALTALALVFSIFRLNPAPFCLLDEVDAPLDDQNVTRFCNLVKELSQQVQFIYITHNKLAMTMAHDLLGVTMPEPGVSKMVGVSLAQADNFVMSH